MNNRSGSYGLMEKSLSGSFRCLPEHTALVVNLSTCVYRTWRGHCPQITPQTGDGFVAQFWRLMGCASKSSSLEWFVLERQFWSSAARQGGEL